MWIKVSSKTVILALMQPAVRNIFKMQVQSLNHHFQIVKNTNECKSVSGILDNFKILWASTIAKYRIKVMLLFVYSKSQKISVMLMAQEIFILLHLKKQTQASAFLTIFLSQWKKMSDIFFAKPVQTTKGKQHEIVQWKKF